MPVDLAVASAVFDRFGADFDRFGAVFDRFGAVSIENGAERKHLNSTRTARPPKGRKFFEKSIHKNQKFVFYFYRHAYPGIQTGEHEGHDCEGLAPNKFHGGHGLMDREFRKGVDCCH